MNPKYPVLAVLPVNSLIIHEHHDDTRTGPLVNRIRASGIFTNPVIVTPLHDHTARYMVLDGANRTTASRKMGLNHILAQVIEPDELGLETQTWNHVVWDIPPNEFFKKITGIKGLKFQSSNPEQAFDKVINHNALAAIHLPDDRVFTITVHATSIVTRNDFLNQIVDTYQGIGRMDRTHQRTVTTLKKMYSTLSGLVFMPKLRIRHLLYLVSQGHSLPAGVTRFSISPRALRVNFPLEILTSNVSLEEKNDYLSAFVAERLQQKGVRYYAEETVLYDE